MCLLYDGSTRRLTESGFMWVFYGFMEKPGIEPATPGLQGIALIHYTTGASLGGFSERLGELGIDDTFKRFRLSMHFLTIKYL